MKNISDIKGIIFDYGGTLDSRGVHWCEVIWQGYAKAGVNVSHEDFLDAYVYAERFLAKDSIVSKKSNFYELMRLKIGVQLDYLSEKVFLERKKECVLNEVAQYCYDSAKECVKEAKSVLEQLSSYYKLGIVINFYGNLNSVLEDFEILKYFDFVVESAEVGIRKPDCKIFEIGVKNMSLDASRVLVVGDSYLKDIKPAMEIGCQVVWLKGKGWGNEPKNEFNVKIVKNINEIHDILLKKN